VNGRKRHLIVDTLGIVLKARVSAANVDDRVGATLLLHDIGHDFPRLGHCWADQGYRGPFLEWARRVAGITVQVWSPGATAACGTPGHPREHHPGSCPGSPLSRAVG
jgi:hypothetical protein